MSTSTTSSGADIVSNLSNLLPTGTLLVFQTLAPLFTNNGSCASVEKIMTSLLVGLFEFLCFFLNFTDSITTTNGKVYYGIVTTRGLFNPRFQGSGLQGVVGMFYNDSTGKYLINPFDYINGFLNLVTFSVLSLLTPPITTCFYPKVSATIIKTVPILFGILVGMYFSFAPHARQGIGFALVTGKVGLASDASNQARQTTQKSSKKLGAEEVMLEKGVNKDSSIDLPLFVRNHGNPVFEPSPTLTPASSPLHRNRGSNVFSQMSPNRASDRDTTGSPASSPIHRL